VSWQWVFFVNVPVGVGAFLLSMRYVPESRAPGTDRRIDYGGAVTITAGLIVLVYAVVNAQSAGWVSLRTLGLSSVAALLLASFFVIEARHRSPLIRLGILRTRSLAGADLVMLLVASGMFAMFFFASLYVQGVLGYSPLRAGLAFLPVTAGIIAGAGLSQQLIRRFGVRAVAMTGMAIAATGLFVLSGVPVNGTYLANLLPGLLTMSLGMGLTFVPITLIATTGVSASDAGLASGLLNTAQQVGGALGLALLATLAANRTSGTLSTLGHAPVAADQTAALVSGFQLAFLMAGFLIASGVVVLGFMVRRQHVEGIDIEAQPALAA
jgi:predicted MFS family arabinose efflux permease